MSSLLGPITNVSVCDLNSNAISQNLFTKPLSHAEERKETETAVAIIGFRTDEPEDTQLSYSRRRKEGLQTKQYTVDS